MALANMTIPTVSPPQQALTDDLGICRFVGHSPFQAYAKSSVYVRARLNAFSIKLVYMSPVWRHHRWRISLSKRRIHTNTQINGSISSNLFPNGLAAFLNHCAIVSWHTMWYLLRALARIMVKWIRFLQQPIAYSEGNVRFFSLLTHTRLHVIIGFWWGRRPEADPLHQHEEEEKGAELTHP